MAQTRITPENWKEVMPVGTIFRSPVSGLQYRITERTTLKNKYQNNQDFRVKWEERVGNHIGNEPWIVYHGEECEIISIPQHREQNINSYEIY